MTSAGSAGLEEVGRPAERPIERRHGPGTIGDQPGKAQPRTPIRKPNLAIALSLFLSLSLSRFRRNPHLWAILWMNYTPVISDPPAPGSSKQPRVIAPKQANPPATHPPGPTHPAPAHLTPSTD